MGAEDVFGIVGTTQAGAYQVEGVVAEGGFAVVYRAYHSAFRAQVALKCLKVPESLGAQHYQEFLERFREEGELLFRLSSSTPAVVRPLHVGILEGVSRFVPFIALEWLEGQTLDALIEAKNQRFEPPLTLKEAVRLLTPVARALERAHHFPGAGGEVCILHRDMKPENVFVVEQHGQRSAKILDFGIGKVKSVATQMVGHQSTQGDGIVAFTPAFGAPEQWLPKRFGQTGPWTDVWGLALTLLNAVTGRPPMEGDQAALLGSAIDPGRRPTPRTEGVDVPDAVERVCAKAVAVDPRDRYQDVGQFWTDLHRAAGMQEGVVTIPPPAAGPFAGQQGLLVSMKPDPMAATRVAVSGPADLPPPREPAPSLEVPDLDLGLPPAKKSAAPRNAEPQAPAKITVMRENDGAPAARPTAPRAPASIDIADEIGPPDRMASAPSRQGHMDGIGLSPRAPPIRSAPARYGAMDPLPGASTRELKDRLRGPIQLVALGIAVMAADFAYSQYSGELFSVGPVRPLWVAGPLVIAGIALALVRFVQNAR
ncbi:MAG: protein kinase [Polyangiaceae bacterium]|nr:protein kinase [Polyangiaceae bacterium]MCE7891077.1 serine/threonine protein kinase [Sorangiineae bacterium PRO1]MCL4751914.1 protein kinase [Myxococcales bacterium]